MYHLTARSILLCIIDSKYPHGPHANANGLTATIDNEDCIPIIIIIMAMAHDDNAYL